MRFSSSTMPNLPRRQRGFSLLELVAAFLVFALGFGALMQILSGSLRNVHMSSEYTQAALWAQSKLDIVGVGTRIKEGNERGDFNDTYHWQLEVRKYQPPAASKGVETVQPIDLYQLDLTVSWGDRHNARTAHFVTLRSSNPDPNGGLALPGGTRGRGGQP